MAEIEEIKHSIGESLEKNFIDNKPVVEKEMNMLNVLISSFDDTEYSYDEYCRMRMVFELEACDNALDVDADAELELSDQERLIIQNRAVRKTMSNPGVDYEEVMKEEYVKWQLDKCYRIDEKMYYQISKYSSMKLIEHKVSKATWEAKKGFFEGVCETKAKNYGKATAEANKDKHEQDIRSSMI